MFHVPVGRVLFVIGTDGLLYIEISHVQICYVLCIYGPGVFSAKADSHTGLYEFAVTLEVIAEHNDVGHKAGLPAGVQ